MEVFDKEGVAVRKNRSEGFVMAEVLVTVLFVTVFTSLLFSSGARHYRSALNFAAGTEARLAAEAVVQILMENMRQGEPTGILEKLQGPEGLPGRRRQYGQRLEMGRKRGSRQSSPPIGKRTVQDLCCRRSVL